MRVARNNSLLRNLILYCNTHANESCKSDERLNYIKQVIAIYMRMKVARVQITTNASRRTINKRKRDIKVEQSD